MTDGEVQYAVGWGSNNTQTYLEMTHVLLFFSLYITNHYFNRVVNTKIGVIGIDVPIITLLQQFCSNSKGKFLMNY